SHGYCAFCKSPKLFYERKHISMIHVLLSLVAAFCINYVLTFELSPSFLLFFSVNLILSEIYVQLRWRTFIICQKCGFDPVLYIKNPSLACEKVKLKLEERKKDEIKNLFFPLQIPSRKSQEKVT
ncbi:MAG: hypothetical protein KDD45_10695, partial [Bdellovibrionales bacterium]|nr:hypothetical protein [Bdellovibrionales bacterium]